MLLFICPSPADYTPLESALKREGLVKTGERVYQKTNPDGETPLFTLKFNKKGTSASKNEYVFHEKKGLVRFFGTAFISRSFLKKILGNPALPKEGTEERPYLQALQESLRAPFIVHALGGILQSDGTEEEAAGREVHLLAHTNSRESLLSSYNRGIRLFEADLNLTADGELVAVHNWRLDYGAQLTSAELAGAENPWGLTTLTAEDLIRQMAVCPDMYLVLDIKAHSTLEEERSAYEALLRAAAPYEEERILDRLIPQIYLEEEYEMVREIYPWQGMIYTLYSDSEKPLKEILAFLEGKEDILSLAFPKRRVSAPLCRRIHETGRTVLTFTVNDIENLWQWMNQGVDGFFTDISSPEAFESLYPGVSPRLFNREEG